MANRFERGKLPPYTIPSSFDRLGTRIIGINEIVGGEAAPAYQLPAGSIVWDVTLEEKTATDNLLPIDGSAISRTEYATLFDTIGVTYGVGDGLSTFNIPSCIELYSRVLGPGTAVRGSYSKAILPLHTHGITNPATTGANGRNAQPNATGEYLNPGGQNLLTPNTGNTAGGFRSSLNPTASSRICGYITTENYTLKIGQIIYGLSDQTIVNSGGKFLKCDAASFNPATYGALASALDATSTPDLRGKFPVVRNFAPGSRFENFGSTTLATHSHDNPSTFTGLLKAGMFYPPSPSRQIAQGPSPGSGQNLQLSTFISSSTYTLGPGGDVRPANVALDFLICAA
jgi:microcystin-dependent protein